MDLDQKEQMYSAFVFPWNCYVWSPFLGMAESLPASGKGWVNSSLGFACLYLLNCFYLNLWASSLLLLQFSPSLHRRGVGTGKYLHGAWLPAGAKPWQHDPGESLFLCCFLPWAISLLVSTADKFQLFLKQLSIYFIRNIGYNKQFRASHSLESSLFLRCRPTHSSPLICCVSVGHWNCNYPIHPWNSFRKRTVMVCLPCLLPCWSHSHQRGWWLLHPAYSGVWGVDGSMVAKGCLDQWSRCLACMQIEMNHLTL